MRKEATVGNLEATNSRKEQRIPEKSDLLRKKATFGNFEATSSRKKRLDSQKSDSRRSHDTKQVPNRLSRFNRWTVHYQARRAEAPGYHREADSSGKTVNH